MMCAWEAERSELYWTWELEDREMMAPSFGTQTSVVSFITWSLSSSLSILCFLSLRSPSWGRRAQLHCLETTVSIRTAGPLWGLNPSSWCLWLSVWIHTGQTGKTIMSYTGCCCLSGQRQHCRYPTPTTPSAPFVKRFPHTIVIIFRQEIMRSVDVSMWVCVHLCVCPWPILHTAASNCIIYWVLIYGWMFNDLLWWKWLTLSHNTFYCLFASILPRIDCWSLISTTNRPKSGSVGGNSFLSFISVDSSIGYQLMLHT